MLPWIPTSSLSSFAKGILKGHQMMMIIKESSEEQEEHILILGNVRQRNFSESRPPLYSINVRPIKIQI